MIELRGHHLDLLCDYLLAEQRGTLEFKKETIIDTAIRDGKSKKNWGKDYFYF